jgi:hypothetical protein
MQQQLFHSLRNAKQLNIRNITKVNGTHEMKPETKRNEISQFFVFRETSEISRNNFFVSLCFVFRETKKGSEMETLVATKVGQFYFA